MQSTAEKPHPPQVQTLPGSAGRGGEAAPRRNARRPFLILGGLVALALLAFGGYALATANEENTDDAQVEADVVPLAARVGGQVLRVKVHQDQEVKKGDTLIELDDADYAARIQQAEAELATAQAQAQAADAQAQVAEATARGGLSTAKASYSGSSVAVATAQAQISAAQAALARAQADAHKAELDLGRARQLLAANAIPQERLDNAQAAYDESQAALNAARAQLAAAEEQKHSAESRVDEARGRLEQSSPAQAQIDVARSNAALAHARVKSAEAALALARNQLSYTRVYAPADGYVSHLSVHEGQLLQPGQPIAELVPSQTYVVANFKETQVGRIQPGQRVEISIDAFPGRKLEGRVESLSGGTGARFSLLPPDNASGNFVKVVQRVPVRIAWVNPPRELALRAGLSSDVTVFVK